MATTLTSDKQSRETTEILQGDADGFWTRLAPKPLARRGMPINPGKEWDAWTAHLDKRKKPTGLAELLPSKTWPLLWALADELLAQLVESPAGRLPATGKKNRQAAPLVADELHDWLRTAADAAPSAALGIEMLSLAHALPCLTGLVAPEPWWDLVGHLVNTAKDASAAVPSDPLAGQYLAGELPLTLAYLLPEVQACADLLPIARENLSTGILELLDGEGLPRGQQLDLLRPLLACWTRCRAMALDLKQECFTDEAETQYEWLVLNALRLARHDGRQMLTAGNRGVWQPELFTAALRLGGDSRDFLAATLTLKGQTAARRAKKSRSARRITPKDLPAPSSNSEWSGVALLRADWLRTSPRLLVKYDGPQVQVELANGADILLSGTWSFSLQVQGQQLEPIDAWEDVCWNSDEEGEYLELEIGYPGGVRVQRQIVLSRRDHVFFLADVVLGAEQSDLVYCGTLPLADGMRFDIARETREGYIVANRKKLAVVLPLALPEWRADPRHGKLAAADQKDKIELRQWRTGTNLYCPLFVDLDPRRFTKQLTWRQLTVAEKLEIQSPDVAVGYRAQTGKEQWMFYRALSARGNRSLLAQNLSSEFMAGRFKPDGTVEEIIEIE